MIPIIISLIEVAAIKEATELSIPSGYVEVITWNDWFIDWCLTSTLAIFQLYRGVNKLYYNI